MTRSLRFHATLFAAVLVVLIATSAGVILAVAKYFIDQQAAVETMLSARNKARLASQLLGFYRGIAERLATDSRLPHIVAAADRPAAERWSRELRARVPELVGAALFAREGALLGDATAQGLGSGCVEDVALLALKRRLPHPSVHLYGAQPAHIDLVVPIEVQGERIGSLFISVDLDLLRRSLAEVTAAWESLLLQTADGTELVRAGDALGMRKAVTETVEVPDTGWRLVYTTEAPQLSGVYLGAIVTVAAAAAGAIFFLWLVVSVVVVRLRGDLATLGARLEQVARGEPPPAARAVHLREVSDMLPAIDRIAAQLHADQRRLHELSLTDALTGLPNRRALEQFWPHGLALAQRRTPVWAVLLDIDHFKTINDRYGHDAGDRVLRRFAEALRGRMRASDFVARLGGDEFVAVLLQIDAAGVEHWYRRLREALRLPGTGEDPGVPLELLSLSAGAARVEPAVHRDGDAILQQADTALYRAKQAGRDTIRLGPEV